MADEHTKASPRFAPYVKAVLACGHWESTGILVSKNHRQIRHIATGRTLVYQIHDGGSEYNSSRNFAADAGRICGCKFLESRGRKKSKKKFTGSGFRMPDSSSTPEAVNEAWVEHANLISDLDSLRQSPSRNSIQEAAQVIRRISAVESFLRSHWQAPPSRGWTVPSEEAG